jgi:uncharacterized protein (TIGR02391 family)
MILNNEELNQLRQMLDGRSGLDGELLARCGGMLHLGNYDQAVHSAFVLLEERLRRIVGKPGMAGVAMINSLFSKNGRLTRHMALNEKDQEKYRNLFDSAFSLYRNPTAHTVTNYDATMGKAIISLVNLLLLILGDPSRWPPPTTFPDNVENAISNVEDVLSLEAANRLRLFLSHCYQIGVDTRDNNSTTWVPFIHEAVQQLESWETPRKHPLSLFYVLADKKKPCLYVPINEYYSRVVGLDIEPLGKALQKEGFRPYGKRRDYRSYFAEHNSEAFFDAFLAWLKGVVEQLVEMEKTV